MSEQVYISEAHLKGYKSILDTQVTFKPGLNIIIGKNGSGKTNLVNYLDTLLKFNIDNLFNNEASILLTKNQNSIKVEYKSSNENQKSITSLKQSISINKKPVDSNSFAEIELFNIRFNFIENLISYNIPTNLKILSSSLNIDEQLTTNSTSSQKMLSLIWNSNESHFLKALLIKLHIFPNIVNSDSYQEKIQYETNRFISILENYLNKYTIIEKVRLNPDFHLKIDGSQLEIKNFNLEYLTSGTWLNYEKMSDGTKRIVYIISEIASFSENGWGKGFFYNRIDEMPSKISFLEEPELGIHPHQLHQLMNFIKEESEEKQIILTTHSPQVLNVLSDEELDRILICEWTPQKGTQLRHMTEKETEDAKVYMKEVGYLSDYWLHSGFNTL